MKAMSQENTSINGDWILDSMIVNDTVLIPEYSNFYLKVSDTSLEYSIGANYCWARIQISKAKIFNDEGVACTEVGGDERYGDYYKYLSYIGNYYIKELTKQLVITNEKITHYLSRKAPKLE